MLFLFKEERDNKPKEFYQMIDFEFIKCIAIIELYLKERWIEPKEKNDYPYSLLYHQTMSYLFGMGAVKPRELAKNILTLTAFKKIPQEDYKKLLVPVFQDFRLFASSIDDNIILNDRYNIEKVNVLLKKYGMYDKITMFAILHK